jgi:hypothetical protein
MDTVPITPLDGLGVALIVVGVALVCAAIIWRQRGRSSEGPIEEVEQPKPNEQEETPSPRQT